MQFAMHANFTNSQTLSPTAILGVSDLHSGQAISVRRKKISADNRIVLCGFNAFVKMKVCLKSLNWNMELNGGLKNGKKWWKYHAVTANLCNCMVLAMRSTHTRSTCREINSREINLSRDQLDFFMLKRT